MCYRLPICMLICIEKKPVLCFKDRCAVHVSFLWLFSGDRWSALLAEEGVLDGTAGKKHREEEEQDSSDEWLIHENFYRHKTYRTVFLSPSYSITEASPLSRTCKRSRCCLLIANYTSVGSSGPTRLPGLSSWSSRLYRGITSSPPWSVAWPQAADLGNSWWTASTS